MKHPVNKLIEAAVAPLRQDAIKFAEGRALEVVQGVERDLIRANWDRSVAAPWPRDVWARDYKTQVARARLFQMLTKSEQGAHRPGEAVIVTMNPRMVEKFVRDARDAASVQYDMFIMKLSHKVGDVLSASLQGNHVWGRSHLTVEKVGGVTEVWLTQQIVNYSKLSTPYLQWPTRRVRGA